MTIEIKTFDDQAIGLRIMSFSGGERHVQLETDIRDLAEIGILSRIHNSKDLLDLLLVVNALRHQFGQSLEIDLDIPYLPYARQDRVCAEGQAFSLQVMAQLIQMMQPRELRIWDCHSHKSIELTGARNIPAWKIIQSDTRLMSLLSQSETVLICPDKGARERTKEIQRYLGVKQIVHCEKQRDPSSGKITHTEVLCHDLTGKTAVITDDICDGGFTFIKVAEQLKAKRADKIILYVTHGIFSKGLNVFEGLIDEIYTTDSFDRGITDPKLFKIHYKGESQ